MLQAGVDGENDSGNRILVVTPQPFYEDRGTPIALRYLVRALSECGFDVDLLAFPHGEDVTMPNLRILRTGNPLRIPSVPIGFSWRKASLDLFLRVEFARRLRRTRYACVHAVEEAAYFALGLCRRARLPLIYDMASSIPEQLKDQFPFRIAPIPRILRGLERRLLNGADFVLCSKGLDQYVRKQAPGCRVETWVYPSTGFLPSPGRVERLRDELGLSPHARVVLYAGSFASYQGLETVIAAMPRILTQRREAALVLVGATAPEIEAWRQRIPPLAKSAVRIVERQPRAELGAYFALADCLISARQHGANAPLKMFDYLATGLPILASRGLAHMSLAHHPRVTLFEHTPEGFASAVVEYMDRVDMRGPAKTAPQIPAGDWSAFRSLVAHVYSEVLREARAEQS